MKYSAGLFLGLFVLVASVTSSLAYNNLPHKVERKGFTNGPVIKLNTRNAAERIGRTGIVMGTCRQLPGKAMVLQGRDNRSYQLPDGVYENGQGFRIHIRMGGIERISISPKK